MENPILFILQGIPESSGLVALSLALARIPLRWGRIIAAGTALTLIVFGIRATALPAGLHTVAGLLLTVILITAATRVPPTKAFVVVLISLISLAFLEMIIITGFTTLLRLDFQQLMLNNYFLFKLLTLPQALILILASLIVPRFMKPEKEAWKI